MFGLYIGIFEINYLSETKEADTNDQSGVIDEAQDLPIEEKPEVEADEDINADASLIKAIDSYRKIMESKNEDMSEKEQKLLDAKCEDIRNREIVEKDQPHEPEEILSDNKILMGPPTLTRFEKARIMGARALQLSLGAPPFIDIPQSATTSLEIAMEELEDRVIPITIRRVNPNGDFQNIPLFNFK
tara:strand:+ start:3584 stop:4144 length:561 start_codon:yes stop_codon:yes gene_type:complete